MKKIASLLSLMIVTGCASVAGEKTQPMSIQTTLNNQEVSGVACTLSNDAGSWSLTTPASVTVHKSTGDLIIDCKKDQLAGNATAVSKSNGAVWGNILLGGGIGYIVDRNTGAGFDYPANISVALRQVDAVGIPANAALAPASAAAAPAAKAE